MAEFITRIRTADGVYVEDFTLSAPPARIIGRADRFSAVTIVVRDGDGNEVETFETTANRRGAFAFNPNELPDGNYTIEVTAQQDGVLVTEGTAILVDTVIEAPVIESVAPETQGDNQFLNFAGTAEANAIVTLFAAGVLIGTTQADENGLWALTADVTDTDLSNVTVEATDAAGNTASSTLEDDAENPIFEQGQSYAYDENREAGDVLATVAASDNVGIVSYAIVGGNNEGWFTIDVTGAITLTEAGLAAAANDFETGSNTFVLTIQVTDASGNTATQEVTLNVEDALDVEDIRAEIYEDSSSDGRGNEGSNNGTVVTAEQLALLADDVFVYTDINGSSFFESRYQEAIEEHTGFSELPTDEEIQALVDEVNKDLSELFYNWDDFSGLALADWDVSNVEDMSSMFKLTKFNQDISAWDVSNVQNLSRMFSFNASFNRDLGGWDVSNVQDMSYMFQLSEKFNQDLDNWDVGSVTNMGSMFWGATKFDGAISSWDVSNVEDMSVMFYGASVFNQDLSRWDVGKVTDMSSLFCEAHLFNSDISAWDTRNVTDMAGMFWNAHAFDQNIAGWDISSLKRADLLLDGSGMSTANFDSLLAGWGTLDAAAGETAIKMNITLGAGGLTFTDVTSKNHLEQAYGWTVGGSQAATDSDGRMIVAGDNTGTVIDLSTESQAQAIHALDGGDTILASAFDDLIVGGAGDDVMTGGGGADTYVFRDYGGDEGDFGHDTITDFEAGAGIGDLIRLELTGLTNFADLLTKATDTENGVLIQIDDGNSILLEGLTINDLNENDFEFVATDSPTFKLGSYGDDTLAGDEHDNRIDGRSGNDTLTGGAGTDTFVFKEGYGSDTITDFSVEDLIEIDAGLVGTFDALLAMMSEENGGADTVIDFGNGDTLTLEGVSKSSLTADEFSFLA